MLLRAATAACLLATLVPQEAVAAPPKGGAPMDDQRFWTLIEQAQRTAAGHGMAAADRQAAAFEKALATLPPQEIATASPSQPKGKPWDERDLPRLFPAIAAKVR